MGSKKKLTITTTVDRLRRTRQTQHAIAPPVLGELDGRALQVAPVLLELGLKPLEQSLPAAGYSASIRENIDHLSSLFRSIPALVFPYSDKALYF